jgi:hypothetical protein
MMTKSEPEKTPSVIVSGEAKEKLCCRPDEKLIPEPRNGKVCYHHVAMDE